MSTTHTAHADHATQAAVRRLILRLLTSVVPLSLTSDNRRGRRSERRPDSRRRPDLVRLLCGWLAWAFRRVGLQALFGDA
jgi:hypothetical protein